MNRYIYVTDMGGLWRLPKAAYINLLQDIAAGESWDLNDYGTMMSGHLRHVTDITPHEAKERLASGDGLPCKRKRT